MREYHVVSPSLEGILYHSSVSYEGITRPDEILKIMDGPATRGRKKESAVHQESLTYTESEQKIIEQYFQDIQGVFMKKLSGFIVAADFRPDESVALQAILQEMIKIKQLLFKK